MLRYGIINIDLTTGNGLCNASICPQANYAPLSIAMPKLHQANIEVVSTVILLS